MYLYYKIFSSFYYRTYSRTFKCMTTLVSRIAAHVLQFFFRKFCPYFRSIRDYAFNNFQKKFRKYSNKIQFNSNPYAFIRNPSTLCLYEIFEMVNPLLLFHTVLQYESLEYIFIEHTWRRGIHATWTTHDVILA